MSVFKSKGIILKKLGQREKEIIYDIFTYDFWRIKCKKKLKTKEKSLDIGYIINFEIETKDGVDIHKIKNIKIKSEFDYEGKSFELIHEYLKFLSTIISHIPNGVSVKEISELVEEVNEKKKLDIFKLQLARLKVLDICWVLELEHSNETVRKILEYISKSRIKDILKLKCDEQEIIEIIARIK